MRRKLFLAAMAVLVCVALLGVGQDAAEQGNAVNAAIPELMSGTVTLKKADYVQFSSIAGIVRCGNEMVDMLLMTKTFKISGLGKDEVVVMFQGSWGGEGGDAKIQLLIDGVLAGAPVQVHPTGEVGSASGYIWTTPPLTAGVTHTATIQWANPSQTCVTVFNPRLIILHK